MVSSGSKGDKQTGGTVLLATLAAMMGATVVGPAHAQDAAEVEEADTITVTARRSNEPARDLPFSVSVVGGDRLEEQRVPDLEEALRRTPGLEVNSYGDTGQSSVRIRGVGALNKVTADDNSVAVAIDGAPQSIANVVANLFDVERIEVLKGPQGTLFGRNSEAGAINVITRRPTEDFEADLRIEAAEGNQRMIEGAISGPIMDTLSVRLAARASEADSHIINAVDGEPLAQPSDVGIRAGVLWRPDSNTEAFLSLEHQHLEGRPAFTVLRPYDDPPRVYVPPGANTEEKDMDRAVLNFEHEFDNFVLSSVTSYTTAEINATTNLYDGLLFSQLFDGNGIPGDGIFDVDPSFLVFAFRRNLTDEEQLSQEIRLSSLQGANMFWTVGAQLYTSDRSFDRRDSFDFNRPSNPANSDMDRDFATDSTAVFGEVTVPVSERLRLTAGLRYTWEDKEYDAVWSAVPQNPNFPLTFTDSQSMSEDFATGRVAATYALTPRSNIYAIYARGHKTGGFTDYGTAIAQGDPDAPYGPATVDSFEAGYKFEAADGRARFNLALFNNETEDDHILIFDSLSFATFTENFDTRSRGAEIEGSWRPIPSLQIFGGASYTDAEITSVPAASVSGVVAGNRVPDSPEFSATLSIEHTADLTGLFGGSEATLTTTLSDRYVGDRAADPQNNFDLEAYHKIDARVALGMGNWEIYAFGDNLGDEQYDLYGFYWAPFFPGGADAEQGYPARGRTFGGGVSVRF